MGSPPINIAELGLSGEGRVLIRCRRRCSLARVTEGLAKVRQVLGGGICFGRGVLALRSCAPDGLPDPGRAHAWDERARAAPPSGGQPSGDAGHFHHRTWRRGTALASSKRRRGGLLAQTLQREGVVERGPDSSESGMI